MDSWSDISDDTDINGIQSNDAEVVIQEVIQAEVVNLQYVAETEAIFVMDVNVTAGKSGVFYFIRDVLSEMSEPRKQIFHWLGFLRIYILSHKT